MSNLNHPRGKGPTNEHFQWTDKTHRPKARETFPLALQALGAGTLVFTLVYLTLRFAFWWNGI